MAALASEEQKESIKKRLERGVDWDNNCDKELVLTWAKHHDFLPKARASFDVPCNMHITSGQLRNMGVSNAQKRKKILHQIQLDKQQWSLNNDNGMFSTSPLMITSTCPTSITHPTPITPSPAAMLSEEPPSITPPSLSNITSTLTTSTAPAPPPLPHNTQPLPTKPKTRAIHTLSRMGASTTSTNAPTTSVSPVLYWAVSRNNTCSIGTILPHSKADKVTFQHLQSLQIAVLPKEYTIPVQPIPPIIDNVIIVQQDKSNEATLARITSFLQDQVTMCSVFDNKPITSSILCIYQAPNIFNQPPEYIQRLPKQVYDTLQHNHSTLGRYRLAGQSHWRSLDDLIHKMDNGLYVLKLPDEEGNVMYLKLDDFPVDQKVRIIAEYQQKDYPFCQEAMGSGTSVKNNGMSSTTAFPRYTATQGISKHWKEKSYSYSTAIKYTVVPYDKNPIMVESARTLYSLACGLAKFQEEPDVLMTQLYPSMESGINMHSDLLNLVPQSPVVTLRLGFPRPLILKRTGVVEIQLIVGAQWPPYMDFTPFRIKTRYSCVGYILVYDMQKEYKHMVPPVLSFVPLDENHKHIQSLQAQMKYEHSISWITRCILDKQTTRSDREGRLATNIPAIDFQDLLASSLMVTTSPDKVGLAHLVNPKTNKTWNKGDIAADQTEAWQTGLHMQTRKAYAYDSVNMLITSFIFHKDAFDSGKQVLWKGPTLNNVKGVAKLSASMCAVLNAAVKQTPIRVLVHYRATFESNARRGVDGKFIDPTTESAGILYFWGLMTISSVAYSEIDNLLIVSLANSLLDHRTTHRFNPHSFAKKYHLII